MREDANTNSYKVHAYQVKNDRFPRGRRCYTILVRDLHNKENDLNTSGGRCLTISAVRHFIQELHQQGAFDEAMRDALLADTALERKYPNWPMYWHGHGHPIYKSLDPDDVPDDLDDFFLDFQNYLDSTEFN